MTYTAHGHHILDSPTSDENTPPKRVARCGGPGVCGDCSIATAKYAEEVLFAKIQEKINLAGETGNVKAFAARRYQTKVIDVIAIKFRGGPGEGHDIVSWIKGSGGNAFYIPRSEAFTDEYGTYIPQIEERIGLEKIGHIWNEARPGDWIVQNVHGDHVPLSEVDFLIEYEPKE